jgi:ribosome maturation factor RimP
MVNRQNLAFPPRKNALHSKRGELVRVRHKTSWKISLSQEVGDRPLFFVGICPMTHPFIPKVIEIATPVAEELGLEIVGAIFHTNQRPPVLRVDIRNPQNDTGLNDCERMSRALEASLDVAEIIPDAYVLEISSPGISRQITTDREFISFKGFPAIVSTYPAYEGQQEWTGQLIRRDETKVYLNQKGRIVEIPRSQVTRVQLDESR